MKEKIERFYSAFGDRGVMFLLFAFSVVVHALLSLNMELPAISPDEYGTAALTAFYTGRDWSGYMGSTGHYYGYIQALFYFPLALVFSSPYALYKAMLVMNGVIISFIPMIAYHLAAKIGVAKVWQKSVIALCCGFYMTYVSHSKFIWNEAISSLLPWLIVWCVYMAWDRKNRYSRFTFSVITGFLGAVCFAAHPRLIAITIAMVFTLLIARIVFKEKILNLPSFFITLVVSFVTEYFFRNMLVQNVWDGVVRINTSESWMARAAGITDKNGFERFVSTVFGHLYTFFTSTLGFGALAVAVLAVVIAKQVEEWYRNRRKRHDDGTKVYEPVKHKYTLRLTVFGVYGFFAVGGSLLLSAVYLFDSPEFGQYTDTVIFGRYMDNAAPLAVFLVLVFIFMYGYSIKTAIGGAGVYAYVCIGFALATHPLLEKCEYREIPLVGLIPWRISEDVSKDFTQLSFIIMSSMVFAVFVLLAVFATCTRRFRGQLAAIVSCGIFLYTTIFAGTVYLPMMAEENEISAAPIKEVSEYIYNDKLSPQVVAYDLPAESAGLIQFLKPNVSVLCIGHRNDLPEAGIFIFENGAEIPFRPEQYEVVGATKSYTVLAYGDSAKDYIRYKNNAG